MANDNEFDLDSQNQAQGADEIDFSNPDAAKEAYQNLFDNSQKSFDNNKQLYARAKKAEGFEFKDNRWTKPEAPKKEPKGEGEPLKSKEPSQLNELDYGQRAFLNSYGVKGSDELSLVKQFQERGFSLDAIVEDDVFTSKLNGLREARETANAIPKGQKRSSPGSADTLDTDVAKYSETGELPSDFTARNKVIDALVKKEKGPDFNLR